MSKIKRGIEKFKEEEVKVRKEVREKTAGYILSALGLVAGLAWNAAIMAVIDAIFPNPGGNSILVKVVYAVVVTIIVVVLSVYLARLIAKKDEEKK